MIIFNFLNETNSFIAQDAVQESFLGDSSIIKPRPSNNSCQNYIKERRHSLSSHSSRSSSGPSNASLQVDSSDVPYNQK